MQFSYRALDGSGFIQQGVLDAGSESEALMLLQDRGYTPVELKAQHRVGGGARRSSGSQSVRHTDIVALIRELATLLQSGVGLSDAFSTLLEATVHSGLREALSQLNASVRCGNPRDPECSREPASFDPPARCLHR